MIMYSLSTTNKVFSNICLISVANTLAVLHHTKLDCLNYFLLDEFLIEWATRKKELAEGKISKSEYMEWKLNWLDTADDCGNGKPKKNWRNP